MSRLPVWRVVAVFTGVALLAFGIQAVYRPPQRSATSQASADAAQWPHPDTLRVVADDSMRSVWVETEQRRYADLLKGHACDTLVVPVQSQHFGFDRATRSLMTAQLASALATGNGRCVVDPYVASSALGDGMRRFDRDDVRTLAASVQASTIVWTYAGQDGHMKMEIFMRVEKPTGAGTWLYKESARKSWSDLAFADDRPPFAVWQDLLPEAAGALGLGKLKTTAQSSPAPASAMEMPDAPEQLVTKPSAGPSDDARRYELLATLGPLPEFRATERLFEKAWLAASVEDTSENRRIRARALFHLHYRPAALALLSGDDSAEARVLRALLDGNLPEAEAAQRDIKAPVQQLIAAIETRDLRIQYDRLNRNEKAPAQVSGTLARSASWNALLAARNGDFDTWQAADNLPLKAMLDSLYPIDGFTIDEVMRGTGVTGDFPKDGELELLVNRHVNRLLAQQAQRFCCSTFKVGPQELDFLQLVSARAQANLEKRVSREVWMQGLPEHALELMNAYDAEFAGHPHFSALRASALTALLEHNNDDRIPEYRRAANAAARSAAYWEQGGTNRSWEALVSFGVPSPGSAPFAGAYQRDFPPKLNWGRGDNVLRYSAAFPGAGIVYTPLRNEQREQVYAEIRSRFHGSREAMSLLVHATVEQGQPLDASMLRAQIENDPGNWEWYSDLAQTLIADADYKGAVAVVQKYPGFALDSGENSVALSNHASGLASSLFWHGDLDSSKTLYELAARYDNGSDASLLASQRLRLIDADYMGAAAIARTRLSRYENAYAFRDYLNLLFAYGYSRDAWAAFMKVAGRFELREFWFAVLVGHRVEGASPETVSEWLTSDAVRSIHVHADIPALRLGMMSFLIDRAPYPELPQVLARVEGPPANTIDDGEDAVLKPDPDEHFYRRLDRSRFRADKREGKGGDSVPSPYVLFAPAYVALRRGDYAGAVGAFAKMANVYRVTEGDDYEPDLDIALPYFEFAAAKSGDTLHLKAFLDGLPASGQRFEYHLAQAYFSGLDHRVEEALGHLKAAFARKPLNAGINQITEYQYAEACVWLFDETHETRYRDLALAWARSYQRMEPVMGWAYALEARYGDPKDKGYVRAVALALYLDRNSFWLSGVPKPELERARAWLAHNNPFLRKLQVTNAI